MKLTPANVTALLIAAVGQVIAFVPSLAPDKAMLISIVSGAVAVGWQLSHGLFHHGTAPVEQAQRLRVVREPAPPTPPPGTPLYPPQQQPPA